jgi:hypothetical protein
MTLVAHQTLFFADRHLFRGRFLDERHFFVCVGGASVLKWLVTIIIGF